MSILLHICVALIVVVRIAVYICHIPGTVLDAIFSYVPSTSIRFLLLFFRLQNIAVAIDEEPMLLSLQIPVPFFNVKKPVTKSIILCCSRELRLLKATPFVIHDHSLSGGFLLLFNFFRDSNRIGIGALLIQPLNEHTTFGVI